MKNNSIRTVVATGIGAALFIIIGMFVNIPIFGNTSIQLQYAVQALFSVVFGPITGFFMGFIGHALKDGIQYGNISWAWVLASAITGLVIGLFSKKYDVTTGKFSLMSMIWFNLAKIPLDGPATHVNTPASTPNARAMAMMGDSQEARM